MTDLVAKSGTRLDADDAPFWLALVTDEGKVYPLVKDGGTTFHFVTEGIESALEQATAAAAGGDVVIAGGASLIQQYLAAGLLDELQVSVAPILLGGGTRLFPGDPEQTAPLEQIEAMEAPGVVHLRYRVGAGG